MGSPLNNFSLLFVQGSNGEGAMVYFQGHWMTPPRFEKLCNMKGKAWRRSLRYLTFILALRALWLHPAY
eukprot:1043614-Pelagomonas_calceolata.AAC.3